MHPNSNRHLPTQTVLPPSILRPHRTLFLISCALLLALVALTVAAPAIAQQLDAPSTVAQLSSQPATQPATPSSAQPTTQPVAISLDEAIARARANEPNFAAAYAASRVAGIDRSIARAAPLPTAIYHNQYLYTQPSQLAGIVSTTNPAVVTNTPRFIANNSVHEYTSQAVVNETIGFQQLTAVARADAFAALASTELELARRGLVATVVSLYYGSLAADHKLTVAQRAAAEAASFTTLTQQRESARESAHADVVKAQLQQQQRERDLADATLQVQKSHLELGVLLFPDPRSPFTLSVPTIPPPLATRDEVELAAAKLNPELQSATSALRVSSLDVTSAKQAYLPNLGLNFAYGIDAAQFAINSPDGYRNLGYAAAATLDIPIWDWFTTQHKIRQAQIIRDSARVNLSATQRRLIAQLDEYYAEAAVSRDQLQSLDLSVQTAQESLRLTRLRYTAGEATVLEVVDAQNSMTLAEIAREDGTIRYQTALANLQILTGTI